MMVALLTAIKTQFDAAAGAALRTLLGHTAAAPKYWLDEAPQGTAHPFLIVSMPASFTAYTMADDLPNVTVDFSVFDDAASSLRAAGIVDAVVSLYNTQLLTVDGYTTLRADPARPGRIFRDPIDKGWRVLVSFEYMLEKAR